MNFGNDLKQILKQRLRKNKGGTSEKKVNEFVLKLHLVRDKILRKLNKVESNFHRLNPLLAPLYDKKDPYYKRETSLIEREKDQENKEELSDNEPNNNKVHMINSPSLKKLREQY